VSSGVGGARGVGGVGGVGDASNINSEVGGVLNVNSGVGGLNKNKDGNMPGHDEIYGIKCLDNMKGVGKMPTIDHFDQIDRNFFQKGPDLLISTNNDSSQLLPPPATLFRLDCMQVMLGNSMGIGVEKVEKVKKVKKDGLFDFPPLQPDNHDCSSHRPSYFGINIKDRVNSTMGGDKIEKNVQNVRKKSIYRRKSGNKVDNDVMNTNNNANIEKMTKLTHLKAKYDIFVTKGGIARLVGLGIYNAGYRLGEEERLTLTSQFLQKKSQVLMQQRPFFPIFTRRSPCLSQESIFKSLFHTINELFCNDRFISIDYPTIITPQLLNNFGSQFPHKKQQFLDEKLPKFQTNSHICSPPSDQFNHHSTLCKSSYKNVFQIDKKFLFVSGLIPLTITFPGLLIPATNRENQHKIDQHDQHNQHNQHMVQMKVGKESGVDGGSGLVHGDQIGVAMAQNRNKRGSIDQIGVGEGQVKGDCTGFGVDGGNLGYNGLNKNVNPKKPSIYSRSRSGKGKLQCENSQNGGNNKFAQNGNYECPKKPFKFTMFHTAHIMIDQHAADERIRLEAITDIFLNEFKNRFVEKYFPQNEKNGEKNDEKSKNLKENCGDFFEKLDYVQPAAQFNQHRHPLSLSSFQGRGKQKIDQQIAEKSKGNVVEKPPSTHFTSSHGELTGKNAQVLKRKNVYELNRVGKNDKNSPQKNNSKNHFCDKKTNAFKKFKHGKYAQSDIISLLDDDNSDCVCIDDYCEVVGDDRGSIKPNLTSPRKDNNTINNDNNNRTDNRDAKGNSYKNKNKNCDNNSDNKNKNDETYRFLGLNNTNNTPLVNIPSDSIDNDLFISKDELSKVKFDDFDQNSWVDENRRGFGDKAKGSNRIGDNTSINGQNMGNVLGKKISVSQFATDLLLLLDKQIDEKIWCNFKLVEKIEVTIPISLIKIFEENQPFLRLFGFEWMELQDRFVIPSGKSVRDKDNMIFDQNGLQKRQIYIELIQVPKILGFSLKNTHFLLLLSEISTQNFILPNIITIEKNYNTVNELVFSLEYIPKFVIDILNLAACRGAQKFNQKMCSNAMGMLLNDLIQCKNPLICAHGRPTTMLILPQYLEGGRNGGKFQGKDGFNFQNDFFFGVNFLKVVLFLLKFYYKIRKLYLIEQNRTGNLTNGLKSAWVRQNNYEFIQDDCFDKKIANILIFLEGQNWFEKEFFSHFAANFVHFSHFSNSSPHIPKQTDGSTPNQNKRGVEDQCRGTGCVYWRCRNREGFSGR
jgi:DNA mismatch repair ATPase MutL